MECTIFAQSFIINLYGSLDCLAWVWTKEKELKGQNGKLLGKFDVGLGPDKKQIRSTFSSAFRQQLSAYDRWFRCVTYYRDAIAHRIPVYIPPYVVGVSNKEKYTQFDSDIMSATKDKNFLSAIKLGNMQKKLAEFEPMMLHSFSEDGPPLLIHPKM